MGQVFFKLYPKGKLLLYIILDTIFLKLKFLLFTLEYLKWNRKLFVCFSLSHRIYSGVLKIYNQVMYSKQNQTPKNDEINVQVNKTR